MGFLVRQLRMVRATVMRFVMIVSAVTTVRIYTDFPHALENRSETVMSARQWLHKEAALKKHLKSKDVAHVGRESPQLAQPARPELVSETEPPARIVPNVVDVPIMRRVSAP